MAKIYHVSRSSKYARGYVAPRRSTVGVTSTAGRPELVTVRPVAQQTQQGFNRGEGFRVGGQNYTGEAATVKYQQMQARGEDVSRLEQPVRTQYRKGTRESPTRAVSQGMSNLPFLQRYRREQGLPTYKVKSQVQAAAVATSTREAEALRWRQQGVYGKQGATVQPQSTAAATQTYVPYSAKEEIKRTVPAVPVVSYQKSSTDVGLGLAGAMGGLSEATKGTSLIAKTGYVGAGVAKGGVAYAAGTVAGKVYEKGFDIYQKGLGAEGLGYFVPESVKEPYLASVKTFGGAPVYYARKLAWEQALRGYGVSEAEIKKLPTGLEEGGAHEKINKEISKTIVETAAFGVVWGGGSKAIEKVSRMGSPVGQFRSGQFAELSQPKSSVYTGRVKTLTAQPKSFLTTKGVRTFYDVEPSIQRQVGKTDVLVKDTTSSMRVTRVKSLTENRRYKTPSSISKSINIQATTSNPAAGSFGSFSRVRVAKTPGVKFGEKMGGVYQVKGVDQTTGTKFREAVRVSMKGDFYTREARGLSKSEGVISKYKTKTIGRIAELQKPKTVNVMNGQGTSSLNDLYRGKSEGVTQVQLKKQIPEAAFKEVGQSSRPLTAMRTSQYSKYMFMPQYASGVGYETATRSKTIGLPQMIAGQAQPLFATQKSMQESVNMPQLMTTQQQSKTNIYGSANKQLPKQSYSLKQPQQNIFKQSFGQGSSTQQGKQFSFTETTGGGGTWTEQRIITLPPVTTTVPLMGGFLDGGGGDFKRGYGKRYWRVRNPVKDVWELVGIGKKKTKKGKRKVMYEGTKYKEGKSGVKMIFKRRKR